MHNEDNQLAIISDETAPVPMGTNEVDSLKGDYANKSNPVTLRATIKAAILKALYFNSKDMPATDSGLLIDATKEYILNKIPNIRLPEISSAIYNGSVGEYGKIYNINLNTVVEWLKQYMCSERRKLALRESLSSQFLLEVKSKPTEHEIKQGKINTAINAFERFKSTEILNDWGNYIFDSLFEFGLLNDIDDREKAKCLRIGTAILKARYTRITNSLDERHQNKRHLEELKKQPFEHVPLYVEVKKLLIKVVFEKWIKAKIELKELLKNK